MTNRSSVRQQVMKSPKKLRFKALTKKLKKGGAKNPKALAAHIGRNKYGKKRMAEMAAKGRKKGKA